MIVAKSTGGNCNGYNILKNQLLAAFCANIGSISIGFLLGWVSPILPLLHSDKTPLVTGPITVEERAWIGGLLNSFAVFGVLIYGFISSKIGPKRALNLTPIPATIAWIIVLMTRRVEYLFFVRALSGISLGGFYSLYVVYIAEISDKKIRGTLGAVFAPSLYLGQLICFVIIEAYLPYEVVPFLFIGVSILFFLSFSLIPEIPQHFLMIDNYKEAEKSFCFYKNYNQNVDQVKIQTELSELKKFIEVKHLQTKVTLKDFYTRDARKAFIVGFCIILLVSASGNLVFMNYMSNIFAESGSTLDARMSSIIVTVIQLFGAICSTSLIDRIGRRTLLIVSTMCCCLGLTAMGTYNYLSHQNVNVQIVNWIPVVSLSVAVFGATSGIVPSMFVVFVEVVPPRIRAAGTVIYTCVLQAMLALTIVGFPILADLLQMYFCMWLFAVCCFFGLLYVIFCLKDTTGKNLHQLGVET